MTSERTMQDEPIYQYEVGITDTVEYGPSLADVLSGAAPVPVDGLRFDSRFEGTMTGRIAGSITGTDFALLRPDFSIELHIHAAIRTGDGCIIAFHADGIARPRADAAGMQLSENVRLTTADPAYAWVNGRQIWASGTSDAATGRIAITGYLQ